MKLAAAMIAIVAAAAACQDKAPPQRHPGAIAAAQQCARVYGGLDDVAPEDRQRAIATACADVLVEKRCRDAFLAFDVPASGRIAHVLDECIAAYCPILPAPKPARCTDPTGDVGALWRAIHLLDLGPEATAILDDAKGPAPAPVPAPPAPRLPKPDDVTWRVPILTITKDTMTLAWRSPDGKDEAVLVTPLAGIDCAKLREQLALEVMRTWPSTVRPTRSKQLLLVADHDAPSAIVFDVMKCANDRSGPRQLYPDVTLSAQ